MEGEPTITVNGTPRPLDGTRVHTSLLDFLRDTGATGAKEGCAEDGQEVVTAEGLGTPAALHPVQREMADRGGSQCGYCTPGFVCSMAAEFYRPDRAPTDTADAEHCANGFDLHAIAGNLCRCTGYRPIRDAAAALGTAPAGDALAERRTSAAPAGARTRPHGFPPPAGPPPA